MFIFKRKPKKEPVENQIINQIINQMIDNATRHIYPPVLTGNASGIGTTTPRDPMLVQQLTSLRRDVNLILKHLKVEVQHEVKDEYKLKKTK